MPGTCAWLVRKTAEVTWTTLEDQVPGGVRGHATGVELTPLGAPYGAAIVTCTCSPFVRWSPIGQ